MKLIFKIILFACLIILSVAANAQEKSNNVFVPISKYLQQGNTEALSAWFADNLEVVILDKGSNSSRNQAKQILKAFFNSYTPRSFTISHTAGQTNMKYALGELSAGGETFLVTIFVSRKKDTYCIQQLKIERIQ